MKGLMNNASLTANVLNHTITTQCNGDKESHGNSDISKFKLMVYI